MSGHLVDSDVLIDILRGARRLYWKADDAPAISVLTRAELFAGRSADPAQLREFLAGYEEIPVDRDIAERASLLRSSTGLRMADAVVAATALGTQRVLVTRNRRHFEAVPALTIEDPDRWSEPPE